MLTTADFKRGLRVLVEGEPYVVVDYSVQTPSARGAATLVRARLRQVLTGQTSDRTFKAGTTFQVPDLVLRDAQYLYGDGEQAHFMDQETYEQFAISLAQLADDAAWLTDGMVVRAVYFEGNVATIELPKQLKVEVLETEPAVRGNTASGKVLKRAVVAGGVEIQVPLYLETGETIEVETAERRFIRRA